MSMKLLGHPNQYSSFFLSVKCAYICAGLTSPAELLDLIWQKGSNRIVLFTDTSEKQVVWISLHILSLKGRHNGRDCVSNHHPHNCSLNRLFSHRSKKTSKFRVTGLCAEFTSDRWIPAQMASNAENVSIWRRRHAFGHFYIKLIIW